MLFDKDTNYILTCNYVTHEFISCFPRMVIHLIQRLRLNHQIVFFFFKMLGIVALVTRSKFRQRHSNRGLFSLKLFALQNLSRFDSNFFHSSKHFHWTRISSLVISIIFFYASRNGNQQKKIPYLPILHMWYTLILSSCTFRSWRWSTELPHMHMDQRPSNTKTRLELELHLTLSPCTFRSWKWSTEFPHMHMG